MAFCIAREVDICSCMQLGQESLVELRTEIPRLGQVGQGLGSRLKDSGEIDTKKKQKPANSANGFIPFTTLHMKGRSHPANTGE